jgi:hypothetical protein
MLVESGPKDKAERREAFMKRSYWVAVVALFVYGCDAARPVMPDKAVPDAASSISQRTLAQEIITDYRGPSDTHAGPGPHPTTESDRYSFFNGGLQWFAGGTVEYRVVGTEPVSGANTAVVAGEQEWDALIAGRNFVRNDATTQTNPCTGLPNTITWASIDGPGAVVGFTSPCYVLGLKEIVGFNITLDTDESWGTNGAATVIDVGDVATHEFGHAVGLGHVGAPRDGCLTMYKFVMDGEIQKRTLGLGEKLGLAAVYGNTNITAGACGS